MIYFKIYLVGFVLNWLLTSSVMLYQCIRMYKNGEGEPLWVMLIIDAYLFKPIKSPELMGNIFGSWFKTYYLIKEIISLVNDKD